jgi:hypothetical protein
LAIGLQHLPHGGMPQPNRNTAVQEEISMIRYVVCLLVLALTATIGTQTALAADTFTFNQDFCGNPCLGGVAANNNGGTVTVSQFATNIVDVLVQLNNLVFHDQGLDSFAFNITGNPTLTKVDSLSGNNQLAIINAGGGTWTFNQPAQNTDGAGKTFDYSLDCTGAAGACAGDPSTLEFRVEVTGITPTSLETLTGAPDNKGNPTTVNVDFAADASANGGVCTGMIGAGNGTGQSTPLTTHTDATACRSAGTVPEPASIMLLGSVFVGLATVVRRKQARMRA